MYCGGNGSPTKQEKLTSEAILTLQSNETPSPVLAPWCWGLTQASGNNKNLVLSSGHDDRAEICNDSYRCRTDQQESLFYHGKFELPAPLECSSHRIEDDESTWHVRNERPCQSRSSRPTKLRGVGFSRQTSSPSAGLRLYQPRSRAFASSRRAYSVGNHLGRTPPTTARTGRFPGTGVS